MERIVFSDGTTMNCPAHAQAPILIYPDRDREWKRITVTCSMALAKEKFVAGAEYIHEWESLGADGQAETLQEDLSSFSVAGDLVDTRDGNISVFMGKPTALELTQAALDEVLALELGGMQA